MFRIAVMGGIGSGKTAVTDYLRDRGAAVIDADVVAREVVEPHQPAWQQLRDAFGDAILTSDGFLDREFVADIVFHDRSALRRLNAITHTAIGLAMARQMEDLQGAELVVVALPLYRREHREIFQLDEVWCVLADPAMAVERLVHQRSLRRDDALARIANQPTNDERRELCDVTVMNEGSLDDLRAAVDALLNERELLRD